MKVRHLCRNPGNVDPQMIQMECDDLTALMVQLKQAQQTAGVAEPNLAIISQSHSVNVWDDLTFDPVLTGAESAPPNSMPV